MRKLALTVIMLVPIFAHAEVLTLQDAIAQGLKNSFDIRSEKMQESVRQEMKTAEQAKFDPAVSASLGAGGSNTPSSYAVYNLDYLKERNITGKASLTKLHMNGLKGEFDIKTMKLASNDPYEELEPVYKTVFEMKIDQPLLKNYGKEINLTDVKNAEYNIKEAQLDLYWKMVNKAAEIESAYYSVSKAKEIYNLAVQSRDLAQSLLDNDKKRFKAGLIPITEIQEAETAKAARDEQVIAADRDVKTSLNNLENLLSPENDLGDVDTEKLNSSFSKVVFDREYRTAIMKRPDLEKQRTELQKLAVTIKYLKNQELPELDLVNTLGVIGLSGNPAASYNSRFEGNYQDSISDMADAKGFEWYVGVNFSMPLGQRAAKARTTAAETTKAQNIYTLKRIENDTKTDIKNAITVIDSGQQRYDVAQTFISLAETTLSQEMKKLNEGLSDTFRVLKFQNDVIEAKMRAVNALYDYNRGTAMLYRASATNLDRYGFKIGE